jgi:hypothetical protein
MKQFFFLLLLFSSSFTYGQIHLGSTEEKIRHTSYPDKVFTEGFTKSGHVRWIKYSDNDYTCTYYFNKNYLSQFCVLLPKSDTLLSYALQLFEKNWIKINDTEWQQTTVDDVITTNLVTSEDKGRQYFLVGSKKYMDQ